MASALDPYKKTPEMKVPQIVKGNSSSSAHPRSTDTGHYGTSGRREALREKKKRK